MDRADLFVLTMYMCMSSSSVYCMMSYPRTLDYATTTNTKSLTHVVFPLSLSAFFFALVFKASVAMWNQDLTRLLW